ncbi:hypothetical protein [Actinomadura chokoriensis]|uniref:Replication initiator protein A n=1 Tax=Actinomadura chokoriensis TaxID=454156 RepID=A0ABV4QTJ4_9ACTN
MRAVETGREAERRGRRLQHLQELGDFFDNSIAACEEVRRTGNRNRQAIRVRNGYITSDDKAPSPPPITRLLPPRGIPLQVHLLALYQAQCRYPDGRQVGPNERPVHPNGRERAISWSDLILSGSAPSVRTNLARQFNSAVLFLERNRLVRLLRTGNGRFGGFQLLYEDGRSQSDAEESMSYTTPMADEHAVRLPCEFFTKGWVHVLSPAEISVYLMLRHLRGRYWREHDENGVYATDSVRRAAYGVRPDSYERHRELAAYGLIETIRESRRRPDGRIAGFGKVDGADRPKPYRFKLASDSCFKRNAREVVMSALMSLSSVRSV